MNTGEIFEFIEVAKELYGGEFIPLHRPVFGGNEKQYVSDCIDSNFVSSVGAKVTEFESMVAKFCGVEFGVATVNGTAALHISWLFVVLIKAMRSSHSRLHLLLLVMLFLTSAHILFLLMWTEIPWA